MRADFQLDLFAVDHNCLGLKVWLPDFLGVALRKADIVAKLFAFAGEFTLLHNFFLRFSSLLYLNNREESTPGEMVYWGHMFESLTASNVIVVLVCLIISITIHEFMHAYVGFRLGDDTAFENGRVSFNPLRHIDPVMTILLPAITLVLFHFPFLAAKPVPFDPRRVKYDEYGAAMLAAAGPLSNLVLAFLAALLLRFVALGDFWNQAVSFFVELNVALFVFNLVPIPPLDGSRVLYAFAPEPLRNLMDQIEPYGFFIVFALVLWGAANYLSELNSFILNLLP